MSSLCARTERNVLVYRISYPISRNMFHFMAHICGATHWESLKLTLKYIRNFLINVGYYTREFYVMKYGCVFYKSVLTRTARIY